MEPGSLGAAPWGEARELSDTSSGETPSASSKEYFAYLDESNNFEHPDFVSGRLPIEAPETDIRLIAFYLPQFHPTPENDEWWGKGFSEWTNVSRALPQFVGHYQPSLPGELGFYDLRLVEIQRQQIDLARRYGIHGFCYHFYWFGGKTLLELPLEQLLAAPDLDFPFCINWANENWTRRWDGLDRDTLIAQQHSPEDDVAFIGHISKYLMDPRYIRVKSRPLVLIYRPSLLPDPRATAERWRLWCRENGIGEIYLVGTHSFEHFDPREIGFDAALEFAPNTFPLKRCDEDFEIINPRFKGVIFDYKSALEVSKRARCPRYKKFRSLCPGWDNDARRPGRGHILAHASPELYATWLRFLCKFTREHFDEAERLVFVNAWNEWAEGAYLEPDRRFGHAYLRRTAEVLAEFPRRPQNSARRWTILFVSHDACRAGAQMVLRNTIEWFKERTAIDLRILCLAGGEWLGQFTMLAPTLVLSELRDAGATDDQILGELVEFCGGLPDLVYGNTVAAGREYRLLKRLRAPILTHVHELESSIERYARDWIEDIRSDSSHFLACSGAVRENLLRNHEIEDLRVSTVPSSIKTETREVPADSESRGVLRQQLGIEEGAVVVFGCGVGMVYRKGADLFIDVARSLLEKGLENSHFYWVGAFDLEERDTEGVRWADHLERLSKSGLETRVSFLGPKESPRDYFRVGDIFLLPSREDPFPLVALEAAECGLPVICFSDAGGMPDFVQDDAGCVVPYLDVDAMAERTEALIVDEVLRRRLGARAREKLHSHFTLDRTAPHILSVCRKVAGARPAVTVIVPNYNHRRYLPRRIESIFGQTFRDFEVILLDDASTDGSVELLERYSDCADVRLVRNERNSGSAFRQWLKGIDLARGDILWIAESDDASEADFLETLVPFFDDQRTRVAYTDSHVIDENDEGIGDYTKCEYLTALSPTKWLRDYIVSAEVEINDGLGVKNTILNISSVLVRRFELGRKLRETMEKMRIAGDWHFLVNAVHGGDVRYVARKLNYHRRHAESVIGRTVSEKRTAQFFREMLVVQRFVVEKFRIRHGFGEKWEEYLRTQWRDWYPDRAFEEIEEFYPVGWMRAAIAGNVGSEAGNEFADMSGKEGFSTCQSLSLSAGRSRVEDIKDPP